MKNGIKMTQEREALEAMWPFLEDELGQIVTPSYAAALTKVADALGKHIEIEPRPTTWGPEMLYVAEIEP